MTKKYIRYELKENNALEEYIKEQLKSGKTLSKKIHKNLDLRKFRKYTYIPTNADKSKLYSFGRSDIAEFKITKHYLISYIKNYLNKDKNNIILFQNSSSEKNDEWLLKAKSKIITFKSEVYHYLTYSDRQYDSFIWMTISESGNTWLNMAMFSKVSQPEKFAQINSFDNNLSLISEIVNNTKIIILDAYDLDSFIFFEKQ